MNGSHISCDGGPLRGLERLKQLHRDESGVISLLTVFVMLGCTWMLLWLLNSAKQLDSKIQLQNAVDAAGQSGTGILARGMNAVAFANQLEADLLAAVIVMRAAQRTPASRSPMAGALLPVFEQILLGTPGQLPSDRPIPAFRRDVIRRIPALAHEMTQTVGRANGRWHGVNSAANPDGPQGPLLVQLWTTAGQAVGALSEEDPVTRTLPLVDPSPEGPDAGFLQEGAALWRTARAARERWVRHYLPLWANDVAAGQAMISTMILAESELELRVLLDGVYARSNLPFMLRSPTADRSAIERDLMFVAVAYRQHAGISAGMMFRNPNAELAPAMAFAQSHLFLPQFRYVCCPWGDWHVRSETREPYFVSHTDGWPKEWDAHTQNWQAKLVPATARSISAILSLSPPQSQLPAPRWGALTPRQWDELTHH